MTLVIIVVLILLCLILFWLFSIKGRTGYFDFVGFKGRYFAHRGLYGDGVPENSLAAFKLACEKGYGAEFDVHLLSDGNLAVIHDHSLKRTAGADVEIESLSANDLQNYFLEGTNEKIPLFKDVLEVFEGKQPVIIELKAKNNADKLCRTVANALKDYNGIYCVESFDPRCVYWFKKYEPQFVRGQLSENYFRNDKSVLPWYLKFVMSFLMTDFLTKPDFVAYRFCDRKHIANKMCLKFWKMQGVTWTVTAKQDIKTADKENLITIFENIEP